MPRDLEHVTVSNLLVANSREWDVEVVSALFKARDRDLTLSISIPVIACNDTWYGCMIKMDIIHLEGLIGGCKMSMMSVFQNSGTSCGNSRYLVRYVILFDACV